MTYATVVTTDAGPCYPVTASRILYTSLARCQAPVNPKRPTWKCKARPVWGLFWEEQRTDQGVPAVFLCDEHKAAWTSGCP